MCKQRFFMLVFSTILCVVMTGIVAARDLPAEQNSSTETNLLDYASGMQNLLNVLGTERQIYWISVYCSYSQWMQMNNQYLAELSKARANFHVIDWYPLARSHPDWLHSDGTHPNLTGAEQYAKLIHDTLVKKISAQ